MTLLQQKYACHDKTFVAIKIFSTNVLLWQAYFCCNKRCVLSQQTHVCRDKTFVITKLSPMIHTSFYKLDSMLESCSSSTVSIFHLEKDVARQQASLLKEEHCCAELTKKINTLHNLNEHLYILYWPSHQ